MRRVRQLKTAGMVKCITHVPAKCRAAIKSSHATILETIRVAPAHLSSKSSLQNAPCAHAPDLQGLLSSAARRISCDTPDAVGCHAPAGRRYSAADDPIQPPRAPDIGSVHPLPRRGSGSSATSRSWRRVDMAATAGRGPPAHRGVFAGAGRPVH